MTDFRPHRPLALEEFLDKIFIGNFFIKKNKKNPNTLPEFGHPHPQIFILFLLEGDD